MRHKMSSKRRVVNLVSLLFLLSSNLSYVSEKEMKTDGKSWLWNLYTDKDG